MAHGARKVISADAEKAILDSSLPVNIITCTTVRTNFSVPSRARVAVMDAVKLVLAASNMLD